MALTPGPSALPVPRAALIVLDGWGLAEPGPGNAIAAARTPVFDELWGRYPTTTLTASGRAVGLPEVGNVGPAVAVGDHRQSGVLRPQPGEASRLFLVAAVAGPKRAVKTILFGNVMAPFQLGAQRAFEAQVSPECGHVQVGARR